MVVFTNFHTPNIQDLNLESSEVYRGDPGDKALGLVTAHLQLSTNNLHLILIFTTSLPYMVLFNTQQVTMITEKEEVAIDQF